MNTDGALASQVRHGEMGLKALLPVDNLLKSAKKDET
jgi:hypothetical protein